MNKLERFREEAIQVILRKNKRIMDLEKELKEAKKK